MKNILKIFKSKFLYIWIVLFLLVALKVVSNSDNAIGWKFEHSSLAGAVGYVVGSILGTMTAIIVLATPFYALIGLIFKKWEAQTMMIIITAITLFGFLGYLWF